MKRLFAFFLLLASFSAAQTSVVLAPVPQLQFFTQTGEPLAFGCVFTYQVASVTPLTTYTDYTGTTQNANPVVLSGGGSANIWLQAGQAYTFVVKSAGGLNCSSGATLYTVNGIGGGSSTLLSVIPYSSTPIFAVSAQNQMFEITLSGNASAQPLTFVGITPPSTIFFQITQNASGGNTFAWPANSVGGCTIGAAANQVTTQEFVYNGINATAVGPCVTGAGPSIDVGEINSSILSFFNNGIGCSEGAAVSGISGYDIFWCDATTHRWNMNNNAGGQDQVVGAATTDTFTNKTFDTAGAGNILKIGGITESAVTGTGNIVVQQNDPTLNGYACATSAKTAGYTLLTSDCIIQANATSSSFTITIPHAATGQLWTLTRTDQTGNKVTLSPDSGTINGATSLQLPSHATMICNADGTNIWCAAPGTSPRAFVMFTGIGSASVLASYNIASVTRTGTGIYTVVFTTPMPSANYVVQVNGEIAVSGGTQYAPELYGTALGGGTDPTANGFSVCGIGFPGGTGTFADLPRFDITVYAP